MQKEDRELGINLIIDGTSYPLTVKASEEPYYRRAAHIVNDRLSLYKDSFSGEGGVRVITMVALDIAFDLIKQNNEVGQIEVIHKVNELTRLIDSALKERK